MASAANLSTDHHCLSFRPPRDSFRRPLSSQDVRARTFARIASSTELIKQALVGFTDNIASPRLPCLVFSVKCGGALRSPTFGVCLAGNKLLGRDKFLHPAGDDVT